jgi:hypothetical protein
MCNAIASGVELRGLLEPSTPSGVAFRFMRAAAAVRQTVLSRLALVSSTCTAKVLVKDAASADSVAVRLTLFMPA